MITGVIVQLKTENPVMIWLIEHGAGLELAYLTMVSFAALGGMLLGAGLTMYYHNNKKES